MNILNAKTQHYTELKFIEGLEYDNKDQKTQINIDGIKFVKLKKKNEHHLSPWGEQKQYQVKRSNTKIQQKRNSVDIRNLIKIKQVQSQKKINVNHANFRFPQRDQNSKKNLDNYKVTSLIEKQKYNVYGEKVQDQYQEKSRKNVYIKSKDINNAKIKQGQSNRSFLLNLIEQNMQSYQNLLKLPTFEIKFNKFLQKIKEKNVQPIINQPQRIKIINFPIRYDQQSPTYSKKNQKLHSNSYYSKRQNNSKGFKIQKISLNNKIKPAKNIGFPIESPKNLEEKLHFNKKNNFVY